MSRSSYKGPGGPEWGLHHDGTMGRLPLYPTLLPSLSLYLPSKPSCTLIHISESASWKPNLSFPEMFQVDDWPSVLGVCSPFSQGKLSQRVSLTSQEHPVFSPSTERGIKALFPELILPTLISTTNHILRVTLRGPGYRSESIAAR